MAPYVASFVTTTALVVQRVQVITAAADVTEATTTFSLCINEFLLDFLSLCILHFNQPQISARPAAKRQIGMK
jgi:hypothetical protein